MDVDITIPAQSVTIPSQDVTATIPAAKIVYSNSWVGQTGTISVTTLLTPSAKGVYRLTTAGSVTFSSSGGGLVFTPTWAASGQQYFIDEQASWQGNFEVTGLSNTVVFGTSTMIFGQSSVPITMEVSFDGPSPTSYDLFVTIEQLQ